MKSKWILLVLLIFYGQYAESAKPRLRVGGLFNSENDIKSSRVFDHYHDLYEYWYGQTMNFKVTNSFTTAMQVCNSTSESAIVALIDARPTEEICDTTCLLCNNLQIPHLYLGWQPKDLSMDLPYTFSYYPPVEVISKAYATLIKDLKWDRFSILYEDDDGLARLSEIYNTWPTDVENKPIVYKKLDPNKDNREHFKYIFKVARLSYHVLDCHVNNIHKYMKEISEVENSTQYQSFILTALDAYKLDFREYQNSLRANVSTLHLTGDRTRDWIDIIGDNDAPLESALTIDAISHLEAVVRIFMKKELRERPGPSLCFHESREKYREMAWYHGPTFQKYLQMTPREGLTGNIEFDENGKRINFVLYYSKLNGESKFVHAGSWSSKTGLLQQNADVKDRWTAGLDRPLTVVSRKGEPYLFVDNINGTETHRGFAVDLIAAIFETINLNRTQKLEYNFKRVPGDGYGNPIAGTKKWDGLIGELLDYRAEMAICDLTITLERISVVDFSIPFMSLGISMLFRKPAPEEPNKFSFIEPLSIDVWLYLGTAYIIVSYTMLISARMCNGDWVNPHPCNRNPETLQNIWDLYNCMWLTMGAIMTQGCDILPRASGSRWVAGFWWFFALILTSSYTANMSAFLSNSRRNNDIEDVEALSKQSKVLYGTVYNASTFKFFKNSNEDVYKKIWSVMESARPTVFTSNNEEGRERVLRSKGKYAFFMESTSIEYYTQKYCDLKMVGSPLDSKEYGIAMPKNFMYKSLVDKAILYLQESGQLDELKKKWWQSKENDGNCESLETESNSESLQMENTSGIFLVLGLGGIIGLFVAIIDFLMYARKIAVNEKITVKEAIKLEWRASLNLKTLHKAAVPERLAAPSEHEPTPERLRSASRAVSVLRAATSFINFDEIY